MITVDLHYRDAMHTKHRFKAVVSAGPHPARARTASSRRRWARARARRRAEAAAPPAINLRSVVSRAQRCVAHVLRQRAQARRPAPSRRTTSRKAGGSATGRAAVAHGGALAADVARACAVRAGRPRRRRRSAAGRASACVSPSHRRETSRHTRRRRAPPTPRRASRHLGAKVRDGGAAAYADARRAANRADADARAAARSLGEVERAPPASGASRKCGERGRRTSPTQRATVPSRSTCRERAGDAADRGASQRAACRRRTGTRRRAARRRDVAAARRARAVGWRHRIELRNLLAHGAGSRAAVRRLQRRSRAGVNRRGSWPRSARPPRRDPAELCGAAPQRASTAADSERARPSSRAACGARARASAA